MFKSPLRHVLSLSNPVAPLIILAVLLFVMVGAMTFLSRTKSAPRKIIIEAPVSTPANVNTIKVPWEPEVESWGIIDDHTTEGRTRMPREAFARAAAKVESFSWEFMRTDSHFDGFQPLDLTRSESDPGRYRGRPSEVVGELIFLETIDTFDLYGFKLGDRTVLHHGVVLSRKYRHGSERAIEFYLVDDPGERFPVAIGEECKVQGVFFKLSEIEVHGTKSKSWCLLGKRVFPSFEIPDAEHFDVSLLQNVADDVVADNVNPNIFTEPPMIHLMAAARHAPESLLKDVHRFEHREIEQLIAKPAEFRGRAIEFEAKVLEVQHYKMGAFFPQAAEGDTSIHEIYHYFVTPDRLYPVRVFSLTPPPEGLSEVDRLHFRGVFYRMWGYRAKSGDYRKAPVMFALGAITRVQPMERAGPGVMVWVICGFVVFVTLLIVVVVWRERRNSLLFRETRRARRQVLRGLDLNKVAAGKAERTDHSSTEQN